MGSLGAVASPLRRLAARVPAVIGSPWTFLTSIALVLVWLATGVLFDFSGDWLLIPATLTSVLAVILVCLLQYTQNRDTRAIQLKLDELIRSLTEARTRLVRLEERSDEELEQIETEFATLRDEQEEIREPEARQAE